MIHRCHSHNNSITLWSKVCFDLDKLSLPNQVLWTKSELLGPARQAGWVIKRSRCLRYLWHRERPQISRVSGRLWRDKMREKGKGHKWWMLFFKKWLLRAEDIFVFVRDKQEDNFFSILLKNGEKQKIGHFHFFRREKCS